MLSGWRHRRQPRASHAQREAKGRRWSVEERDTIVRASLKKGTTVNAVARLYGVQPWQIYEWRKQARQAAQQSKAATLVPVQVTESDEAGKIEPKQSCSVVIEAQSARITITGLHRCHGRAHCSGVPGAMIAPPANARIWIAAGVTDLRRGFGGLSALVQTALEQDPYAGHVFVFRGRRGDLIKLLWWDGDGLCLFAKRLERGRFVWPKTDSGTVALTRAQLSMLLEGIDWRQPARTWKPEMAV